MKLSAPRPATPGRGGGDGLVWKLRFLVFTSFTHPVNTNTQRHSSCRPSPQFCVKLNNAGPLPTASAWVNNPGMKTGRVDGFPFTSCLIHLFGQHARGPWEDVSMAKTRWPRSWEVFTCSMYKLSKKTFRCNFVFCHSFNKKERWAPCILHLQSVSYFKDASYPRASNLRPTLDVVLHS